MVAYLGLKAIQLLKGVSTLFPNLNGWRGKNEKDRSVRQKKGDAKWKRQNRPLKTKKGEKRN